jgi:hypothetical protein
MQEERVERKKGACVWTGRDLSLLNMLGVERTRSVSQEASSLELLSLICALSSLTNLPVIDQAICANFMRILPFLKENKAHLSIIDEHFYKIRCIPALYLLYTCRGQRQCPSSILLVRYSF